MLLDVFKIIPTYLVKTTSDFLYQLVLFRPINPNWNIILAWKHCNKNTHCFFFLSIFFQFHSVISQTHVVSVSALRCKWHYFIHSARSCLVGRYFYIPDSRRPSGRQGSRTDTFLLINTHTYPNLYSLTNIYPYIFCRWGNTNDS